MVNVIKEVNKILKENNYHKTVPVLIDNKFHYWDKAHVRAYQVFIKHHPEYYDELENRVVIYGGNVDYDYNANKKSGVMEICKDGYFEEKFITGFYDISTNLAFELM